VGSSSSPPFLCLFFFFSLFCATRIWNAAVDEIPIVVMFRRAVQDTLCLFFFNSSPPYRSRSLENTCTVVVLSAFTPSFFFLFVNKIFQDGHLEEISREKRVVSYVDSLFPPPLPSEWPISGGVRQKFFPVIESGRPSPTPFGVPPFSCTSLAALSLKKVVRAVSTPSLGDSFPIFPFPFFSSTATRLPVRRHWAPSTRWVYLPPFFLFRLRLPEW